METRTQKLSKVDKARIELWTAHDLTFVISKEKGVGTIPRFTPCVKPVYTHKIKDYLFNMEEKGINRPPGVKAVCVKLEGMLRYLWRTDVLTKQEYEEVRRKERTSAVGVFGSKSKRAVGQG
jgi:hypothetical protein